MGRGSGVAAAAGLCGVCVPGGDGFVSDRVVPVDATGPRP